MAISYDDWKKSYTQLDTAWKQKFVDLAKNSDVWKEYMQRYASEMNGVNNKVGWTQTTPNQTQTTPTPTPTPTPTTPTPTTTTPTRQTWVDVAGIKNMWDNLSYDDQQKYLGQYKGLQESLTAKGITNKAKPEEAAQTTATTPTTPTKTTTPTGKDEWDYQDSSEWRIYEIAWHLNDYRVSQPNLFNDWETFSNFFIDWKDRSQEQLNYLRDYFNAVKRYNSLDNMTADTVWNMMVNGAIPDDYLNYVKYSNPQRYSEIMDAKARATDRIKDSASMDTVKSMEWETDTTTSKSIEWLKNQWLFLDKDWNLIDDRTENYASEEENKYLKQLADLAATNLDIDNTVKHTYDDLVERYPWATKATLMAMAQDMNSDLLREKENNLVEMTRLQGYVWYMQSERQERDTVGQNAINQLQKQYWMYYEYSPEWIAELTEAQYSATNITLDQADTWTDAQKQMALDAVLTPIYEQYWSIIERPQAQVVNDVIAYAKEKGITLSQALKENFTDFLKQKPAYKNMQSQMANAWWDIKNVYIDWEQQSIWFNPYTQESKPLWYSYNGSNWKYNLIWMNERWEWDYFQNRWAVQETMREWANQWWNLEWATQNIAANMEGSYLWLNTCWYYVNDYIYWLTWVKWPFWSEIQNKRDACTNTWLKWAKVWDAIVFDWNIAWWVKWVSPEYWHVWIITWSYEDWSIDVSSTISWKVQTRHVSPWDAWYNNIYWTRSLNYVPQSETNPEWHPMYDRINEILYDKKNWLTKDQLSNLQNAETMYRYLYKMADDWSLQHFINSNAFQLIMKDMVNTTFSNDDWWDWFASAWAKAVAKADITDPVVLQVANRFQRLIELKLRKESWAAISSSEWKSNFSNLLPQAWEDASTKQDKLSWWEEGLIYPTFRYSGMPQWYVWLFNPNKWLFKDIAWGSQEIIRLWDTPKWTWNISNYWAWNVADTKSSPYNTLFNQLGIYDE